MMKNKRPKIGGCKRGVEDPRDFIMLCGIGDLLHTKIPDVVDLKYLCSPVEDQRAINSCTANACVGAMEILEKKQGLPQHDLSRLYVYYNTRDIEDNVMADNGAYLSTSMKAIKQHGACLESLWPYKGSKVFKRPLDKCYVDGSKRQAVEYARVLQGHGVVSALAAGYPVVFGMTLEESFADTVGETGVATIPAKNARFAGGHAMLIVGYNLDTKMYIVRNSWGPKWGDKGYCEIPFRMVNNRYLSWDFWVIRSIEEPEGSSKFYRPLRRSH